MIVAAGTSAEAVQRYLNWSSESRGTAIMKKVCGVLVLLGGLYLLRRPHISGVSGKLASLRGGEQARQVLAAFHSEMPTGHYLMYYTGFSSEIPTKAPIPQSWASSARQPAGGPDRPSWKGVPTVGTHEHTARLAGCTTKTWRE
jgi:hypothetical protein